MVRRPPLSAPSLIRRLRFRLPCVADAQDYFETRINGALLDLRDRQYRAAGINPTDPARNPDVTWDLGAHEKTGEALLVLEISYGDPDADAAPRGYLFAEKYALDMEQALVTLLKKGLACEKLPERARGR